MNCPWQVDYHRMSQLDVGKCGVWAVDENKEIFYREGTYCENGSDGSHWVKVSVFNTLFGEIVCWLGFCGRITLLKELTGPRSVCLPVTLWK